MYGVGRDYVTGDHHHAHLAESSVVWSNAAERVSRKSRSGAIGLARNGSGSSGGCGGSSLGHPASRAQWLPALLSHFALVSGYQWRHTAHRPSLCYSRNVFERFSCGPCGPCGPRCSCCSSGHLSQ